MSNFQLKDGVDAAQGINAFIPTGAIILKPGNPSILSNYDTDAKCLDLGAIPLDGRSLSTTTYASLFSVIEYTYGGSGGSFSLPDMRTSTKYLSASATGTPSVTNNSNTITHNHSIATTQSNFANNNTATNHSHNITYTGSTVNTVAAHTHGASLSFNTINSGQATAFTQSKQTGNATASASNHSHVRNAFSGTFTVGAAANNATNTPHSHTQGATTSTADHALPTHVHNASSSDSVVVGTSSSYTYPTISLLFFVKI
jgi:microcystin-dependent protein